jgi:hypothetical protein
LRTEFTELLRVRLPPELSEYLAGEQLVMGGEIDQLLSRIAEFDAAIAHTAELARQFSADHSSKPVMFTTRRRQRTLVPSQ